MAITKFTKSDLQTLRREITDALTSVLDKHELSLKLGSMSYNAAHFHCKLEVNCGSNSDNEKREFGEMAGAFGLTIDDYRKTFTRDHETFWIVALKPRSPKFAIVAENRTGKRYKFTSDVIDNLK